MSNELFTSLSQQNTLTPFRPMFCLYTPWKRQKTFGFLTTSRSYDYFSSKKNKLLIFIFRNGSRSINPNAFKYSKPSQTEFNYKMLKTLVRAKSRILGPVFYKFYNRFNSFFNRFYIFYRFYNRINFYWHETGQNGAGSESRTQL